MTKSLFPLVSLFLLADAHGESPVVKVAEVQATFVDGSEGSGSFDEVDRKKGLRITLLVRSDEPISTWHPGHTMLQIGGAKDCSLSRSSISRDHKFLRLELFTAAKYASADDGTVKVTGEIPLTLAAGIQAEKKSLPFRTVAGEKISFNDDTGEMPEMAVKFVRNLPAEEDGFEVTVTTNRKAEEFARIRFLSAENEEIQVEQAGSTWMESASPANPLATDPRGSIIFIFKTLPDGLRLGISSYQKTGNTLVKVDLEAGLGAPKP